MRRFLGTVLAGLGALLIIVAVGLPLYVAPRVTKVPYELVPCKTFGVDNPPGCVEPSVATAPGATFLQIDQTGGHINTATLQTTIEVVPQVKLTADEQGAGRISSNTVIWDVDSTTVRTDTGATVSQLASEMALDRTTGAADPHWSGQWIDSTGNRDNTVRFSGQEYLFPFDTQKQSYQVFDNNLRAATTATFASADPVGDLTAYHFVQNIAETTLTLDPATLSNLQGLLAPSANSVKVTYQDTREIWIAPTTGQIVREHDHPVETLVPDTGSPVTLLDADFRYTPKSEALSVQAADAGASRLGLVRVDGPALLGPVGVVVLAVGLWQLRRRRSDVTAPPATGPTAGGSAVSGGFGDAGGFGDLPEPRHRLRGDESTVAPN
jgi:hypothetical protein